jgi:hypothetical protein
MTESTPLAISSHSFRYTALAALRRRANDPVDEEIVKKIPTWQRESSKPAPARVILRPSTIAAHKLRVAAQAVDQDEIENELKDEVSKHDA